MANIAVLVSPRTFAVSLGAMTDIHARLGEVFESNEALGNYAGVATRLTIAASTGVPVHFAGGMPLPCSTTFTAIEDARLIYLPAFQVATIEHLQAILKAAEPFHVWLARAAAGTPIGAAGASVFHLAAAGLLDGGECAVPPRLAAAFQDLFPRVSVAKTRTLCVSDGPAPRITCSRDWQNGALAVRLLAAGFSTAIAESLALREPPEGDAGFVPNEPDPVVARARTWIRDRFARDFRIADLARELGVSHQGLIRRFRATGGDTPRSYVQRLRCETAASMLVETRRTVSEIAQLVGYRDIASFRDVFAAHAGMSPSTWRRTQQCSQKRPL
ncbi:GlxA family transcriptional regulator [Novosphingobium taihuense]|uniref:Transcriptional regulator GlxA family with amidase domain n=1 Tax=Novosphingobium taihuense TaxID=260085 RepID=A0A7W7AEE0_9SPHN|nr:helix-turn-helix domain-containing protein [Novosphingobium taihuense]MBB4615472.1 transcriptional regulator GlxA family with amidase domain [Novosphingobium taihuense]TWH82081.1 transcriptional regulator GlxA family with amidase domain [Novosphingobium taihuense]